MAFDYEDAGTFGSEREAKDWAQRNKVETLKWEKAIRDAKIEAQ